MGFRDYLFAPDDPRVQEIRGLDAHQYAEAVKSDAFAGPMIVGWAELYPEPFTGITSDGTVRPGLFDLEPNGAPTAAMVEAADALLALLPAELAARLSYAVDAHEWRSWANPEFLQHDTGLRLDEVAAPVREAILAVVAASLSDRGFELVRDCMRINGFLGDVVELPLLMNEFSYNFALFGDPSLEAPWGWHLFGHHVGVNCLVIGDQLVVSPVFLGAEPDEIDDGPLDGTRVFDERIVLARQLMGSLTPAQRSEVVVFEQMVDPAMPPGRIHPGDERHLGGCFQDNRVVPYEGVLVSSLPEASRELVSALFAEFVSYLPASPAAHRLREIETFYDETWLSWIGGWEGDEPFYFRLQSPVVMIELDHHTGVFLTNTDPGAFHIHTVVRTPNGNDYGRALVARWSSGAET